MDAMSIDVAYPVTKYRKIHLYKVGAANYFTKSTQSYYQQ